MAEEIKFGGIPEDILAKLLRVKSRPEHFNPHIHKTVYEFHGEEIIYNSLTFRAHITNNKGKASNLVQKLFSEFFEKNPEVFFEQEKQASARKWNAFLKFVSSNKKVLEEKEKFKVSETLKSKNSGIASSLQYLKNFLDPRKITYFDKNNYGIMLPDEVKPMLRKALMDIISVHGANIEKDSRGSITKFFLVENPMTRKGKEYTISYYNMPQNLQNKYGVNAYVYFEVKDMVLKAGEGKKYKSKLYEETTMEETNEINLEEALDIQQRRKRGLTMRRFAKKIAMARKRASRRMANTSALERRARRQAINMLRKRFAGTLGANYANLSPAQKMQVDKRVETKKSLIGRIAKRLLPKMKKKEMDRLANRNKNN